jgi:hypothetical protein
MQKLSKQERKDVLRRWRKGKFSLTTYWLGRKIGYRFKYDGKLIFEGRDFGPSPMHAIDGIETVISLLGFLSLQKGDTDVEYFADYTKEQMEFSENHGEELSLLRYELERQEEWKLYKAQARKNFDGSKHLFDTCWREYLRNLSGTDEPNKQSDVDDWLNTIASEKVNNPKSQFYIYG